MLLNKNVFNLDFKMLRDSELTKSSRWCFPNCRSDAVESCFASSAFVDAQVAMEKFSRWFKRNGSLCFRVMHATSFQTVKIRR